VSQAAVDELEGAATPAEVERFRAELRVANARAREAAMGRPPPATVRAYRQVYGRDPGGWPPASGTAHVVTYSRMIEVILFRAPCTLRTGEPADAPTVDYPGTMARVKATLLRRRFAALTRAMRSRKCGHLSERRRIPRQTASPGCSHSASRGPSRSALT
jgi:hypothetical protein